MKSSKIFLVEGDRKLTTMEETFYEKEDDLQALLEAYSDLLPGDQIDPDNPRRWLFISRELGVPGSGEEVGRWSLDHLFLDQDGIPTFVECKRSSDTRNRREVVAQMLDYAANGTKYWKMEYLRQAAAETAQKNEKSLDEEVRKLVDQDEASTVEDYWELVENNLKTGNVRLVFVADKIPTELRRLVEFLNEQMVKVEVLAVEVKQYLGGGNQKAIVPRVIGMTETARDIKQSKSKKQTNREAFLAKCVPQVADFFTHVLDIASKHKLVVYWGQVGFSLRIYLPAEEKLASIIYGYPPPHNNFSIYLAQLPFTEEKIREIKNDLLAYELFKEAPKTLTAYLEDIDLSKAREACELAVEKIEALISKKVE